MRVRRVLFVVAIPLAYLGGIMASWTLGEDCGDVPEAQTEGSSWQAEWSWLPPHTTCRVDTATTTTVYYESWEIVGVFFAFFLLLAWLVLAPASRGGRTLATRGAVAAVAAAAVVAYVFL